MNKKKQFIGILGLMTIPFYLLADSAPEWGFTQIRKPTAKASSILKEPKKTYPASQAIDGKVTTAWCEGVKGSGIGETLELQMSPTPGAGISVFPGFGGNKNLYYANNRIKGYEVTITTKNGRTQKFKGEFEDDLCGHSDHRACIQFEDSPKKMEACEARMESLCHRNDYNRGGQIFFDKPECIVKVEFKILSVFKGKKHDDTCISDLDLLQPIDASKDERDAFEAIRKSCK